MRSLKPGCLVRIWLSEGRPGVTKGVLLPRAPHFKKRYLFSFFACDCLACKYVSLMYILFLLEGLKKANVSFHFSFYPRDNILICFCLCHLTPLSGKKHHSLSALEVSLGLCSAASYSAVHVRVYAHMHTHMHINTCTHTYSLYMCVCMHTHIFYRIYACVCIHTHTPPPPSHHWHYCSCISTFRYLSIFCNNKQYHIS